MSLYYAMSPVRLRRDPGGDLSELVAIGEWLVDAPVGTFRGRLGRALFRGRLLANSVDVSAVLPAARGVPALAMAEDAHDVRVAGPGEPVADCELCGLDVPAAALEPAAVGGTKAILACPDCRAIVLRFVELLAARQGIALDLGGERGKG